MSFPCLSIDFLLFTKKMKIGFSLRQAYSTDPMFFLILENTYEAVLDAGYHPLDLKGTNTGVFIGACMSETESYNCYERSESKCTVILG